jgi:precorrin-2 dehydrogenase / sirohydrochlorin ferrochelatase
VVTTPAPQPDDRHTPGGEVPGTGETPETPGGPGTPGGYPVVLDLTGRRCLVVGGGPVATRRALGVIAAGASVTVVAPDATAELRGHPDVTIERRPYRTGEAGEYDLVVTATGDPEVDRLVVADATAAGALAAGADTSAPGTVRLPAVHRDGRVTIAVSTGGASPALARWLLGRVAASLPAQVDTIATLVEEARGSLLAAGRRADSIDWTAVLDEQVVPLVEAGRIDEARAVLGRL